MKQKKHEGKKKTSEKHNRYQNTRCVHDYFLVPWKSGRLNTPILASCFVSRCDGLGGRTSGSERFDFRWTTYHNEWNRIKRVKRLSCTFSSPLLFWMLHDNNYKLQESTPSPFRDIQEPKLCIKLWFMDQNNLNLHQREPWLSVIDVQLM